MVLETVRKLIIIPAFNEQDNIDTVFSKLKLYASDYDYIVINDASTDKTYEECRKNNCNVIDLAINLGIGGAVQTGFKYAVDNGYDIAVQIDGDGQHNPEYLEKIIQPIIRNEADVVIGSRFISNEGFQSSFLRRIGINIINFVLFLVTKQKFTDCTSGFRAYNKEALRLLGKHYPKDYPEPESLVMLSKLGFKIIEVPVVMNERTAGQSSIRSFKIIYYMLRVCLSILIDALKYKNREKEDIIE